VGKLYQGDIKLMFKDGLLKDKHILVTGGGTGLGKEMAKHFAKLGADISICGRREEPLKNTTKELQENFGINTYYETLDIRSAQDVESFIDNVFAVKPLTGLVNNAAGNFISPTHKLSSKGFDAIANIVMHGTFYITHCVGQKWIRANLPGSIISILATWIWTGSAFVVPSAMSKSALHAMTMSLAVEWGPKNIRVNAIAPGAFPTKGMTARLDPNGSMMSDDTNLSKSIPMGRYGKMEELQNLASFLMSDGCDYLTGQSIALDGAQHLSGGGTFSNLASVSDQDWDNIKAAIQQTNAKDKEERS
jgi:NAD(P)-dependent dehydrogenase (short-subunit alcohol dehydrogenase family)